jgi:hypothetical protein
MLKIDERSYSSVTTDQTASLSGYTFWNEIEVRDNCSAEGPDIERLTGASITWQNRSTGQAGKAFSFAGIYDDGSDYIIPVCRQLWKAENIVLQMGRNEIVLHLSAGGGYFSDQTVVVQRISLVTNKIEAVNKLASSQVLVTWEGIADATSYNIYWYTDPINYKNYDSDEHRIHEVSSPYVVDTDPLYNTKYYYTVRAVKDGVEFAQYPTVQSAVTTTDTTPLIVLTQPVDGARSAFANSSVQVDFWEPIDCASVSSDSFVVNDKLGIPVSGTITCGGARIVFTPPNEFIQQETYKAVVSTAIKDLDGDPLPAPYSFSFTVLGRVIKLGGGDSTMDKTLFDMAGNLYRVNNKLASYTATRDDYDFVITKLDQQGAKLWENLYSTSNYECAREATADADGNLFVAGYKIYYDQSPYKSEEFLMKLDSSGKLLWEIAIGSSWVDKMAADRLGNIYAVWTKLISLTNSDIILAKYDTNGKLTWTTQFGSSSGDQISGLAVDNSGNIYVSSWTDGDWFQQIPKKGRLDKVNPSGQWQWTKQLNIAQDVFDMVVDHDENLVIASNSWPDLHLAKYDPNGKELWFLNFGNRNYDRGYALTIDQSNSVYVTGYTDRSLAGNPRSGFRDVFMSKYDTQGNSVLTYQSGMRYYYEGHAIHHDGNGIVTIFGYERFQYNSGLHPFLIQLSSSEL